MQYFLMTVELFDVTPLDFGNASNTWSVLIPICFVPIFPDSPAAPELTDARLVLLSNEITSRSKLRTLATVGLNVDSSIVSTALRNNRDDITEAAHTVLTQWRDSQPNKTIAYKQICEVLRRVKMEILITEMLYKNQSQTE